MTTSSRGVFKKLLADGHRAIMDLDGVTNRDGIAREAAVTDGTRICARLRDFQRISPMTRAEAAALQTTLDLLDARLKFLGGLDVAKTTSQ